MGSSAREKSLRGAARKARQSVKPTQAPPLDPTTKIATASAAAAAALPSLSCSSSGPSDRAAASDLHANLNPSGSDESCPTGGWGYCTEDQLEELLLKNLEIVYKEALSRLVALGYDEAIALRAILRNGHCYGSMDVLSNILHNALSYLSSNPPHEVAQNSGGMGNCLPPEPAGFSDLRHLEEYSLAGMVCLLQQVRPHLTRGDAMWCLLMADLHVGRASTINMPSLHPSSAFSSSPQHSQDLAHCKFHSQCESFSSTAADPVRCFDLHSNTKSLLKRHASKLASAANGLLTPSNMLTTPTGQLPEHKEDRREGPNQPPDSHDLDLVASVLKSLEEMHIEEGGEEPRDSDDHKKAMIVDLCRQIQELEVQLKERKEWAQQKALQAARKLSNDLTELKILRIEREENQMLKKGKQVLEDSTSKRLSEMEAALRKASGQVDRVNAEVRRLEADNAEIRAEIEASKLSAAESAASCVEATKREKKCLKKLITWEKQRDKMQAEIADQLKQATQIEQQLHEVREASKEAEEKWRQELKAKELAMSQVEEERRAKEEVETNTSRRHDALRRKIEIDFQRQKDDVQRLKEEHSRLKVLVGSAQSHGVPPVSPAALLPSIDTASSPVATRNGKDTEWKKGAVSSKGGLNNNNNNNPQGQNPKNGGQTGTRHCVICRKEEVRVVFLPCTHQVLCVECNGEQQKCRKSRCPCCDTLIEQRIRVFGPAS